MKKILIILILLILLFFTGGYFLNNDSEKKVVRKVSRAEELALARLSHSSSKISNTNDYLDEDNLDKKLKINDVVFNIYSAENNRERAKGLSGKESIALNEGMLFTFDSPSIQTFWMKDMKFDLDIIWIDENFKIAEVSKNVSKDSYNKENPKSSKLFNSVVPVKYVLEVNAGQFDKNGFKIGDKVEILK